MKTRDWHAVVRRTLSAKGFVPVKRLAVYSYEDGLLRGLGLDDSAFDSSFTVWYFVQPLFEPGKSAHFGLGDRLRHPRGGDWWWDAPVSSDAECEILRAVETQAIPFFSRNATVPDLAQFRVTRGAMGYRPPPAFWAYWATWLGRPEAVEELRSALGMFVPDEAGTPPAWVALRRQRADELQEVLDAELQQAGGGREVLERRAAALAQALGLPG